MNTRLTPRRMTTAMVALILAAMVTGTAAAQNAPQQTWAGNRIREASMNWADYIAEPAETEMPRQTWAGPMIQVASTNWADYASEPVAVSVRQRWAGQQIQQASINWADYSGEPLAASNP